MSGPERPRRWLLSLAAALAAAVPIAFGLVRAVSTGTDFRYVWMAAAAFAGSGAAFKIAPAQSGVSAASLTRVLAAVASGAACAAAAGVMQGATAVSGIVLVSVAFGLCTGAAGAFALLARSPSRQR